MGKQHRSRHSNPSIFSSSYGLAAVLLIFMALAGLHSVIVPITQGEDELAHYRYIRFIAENGRLPATPAEREQAWYRADWPPLYHLLVGWAVSSLDTTQPHLKDVGESPRRRLVGEIFYPRLIIYTEDAAWPWQDGILAWHIGRFISILFSTVALVFVYLTALDLGRSAKKMPGGISPAGFALAATALLAFTPRFIFTSAMLSDDSLFILLSAIFIWLLLRALRGDDRWRLYTAMGLLLGLSIATKYSTGLFPLLFIPLLWWRWQAAGWHWRTAAGRLLWGWLWILLGASWWFGWIIYHFNSVATDGWLYGLLNPVLAAGPDVSMRRVFDFLGGGDFTGPLRPDAVSGGSFADWLSYLFQTFWGVPVLEYDPLFPWAYLLLLPGCLLALAGLGHYWRTADPLARRSLALLVGVVGLLFPFPLLRYFLTFNILETGQGRHILYPAAQSIPILLTLGWLKICEFANLRINEWANSRSKFIIQNSSFIIVLLLWSLFQAIYMTRTYPDPLPVRTTTFRAETMPQPLKHTFSDSIQLLGYDYQPDPAQAVINLTLFWKALAQVDENYRVRVQLVDPDGVVHFTWLSHPLNGLYPTRAWDAGDVIRDALPLPLAAVPPHTYSLQLDWVHQADLTPLTDEPLSFIQFDLTQQQPILNALQFNDRLTYRLWPGVQPAHHRQTLALSWHGDVQNPRWTLVGPDNQPRLPVISGDATGIFIVGGDWPSGDYRLTLPGGETTIGPVLTVATEVRRFDLPPALAAQPHWTPVAANFAGQIELRGYALPTRRFEAGGSVPLTVAWRGLAPVLPDAITFAVLLDANQQPYGSVDRYPAGFYSPLLWVQGEIVPDEFRLPIRPNAPPGIYTIHLGQYRLVDGQPQSLLLYHNGQPTDSSAVVLGPLKIGGPPPDVIVQNPQPQHSNDQTFGDQITLLGYDLTLNTSTNSTNSKNAITLKLYWQTETIPAADYTVFLHLRDAAGQNVAQKDQPPTAGRYPTSLWAPGEIIADNLLLPLIDVPPGRYTPVVGLYEPRSGLRLSLPDDPARTEIELEPVQIE